MENYELLKEAAVCYSEDIIGYMSIIETIKNNDEPSVAVKS
jgi:hypothetical protein